MKKSPILALAVAFLWLFCSQLSAAEKSEGKERAELAKALKGAKVSLEKGLAASEKDGKPLSGKYELDDGKLQLSVYTVKADKFFEVIVDHSSGKIAKTEAITSGDDFKDARAQKDAMDKAKVSVRAATEKVVKSNKGYRAVSVTPSLKEGHPVADVTLAQGEEFKTVSEKLD